MNLIPGVEKSDQYCNWKYVYICLSVWLSDYMSFTFISQSLLFHFRDRINCWRLGCIERAWWKQIRRVLSYSRVRKAQMLINRHCFSCLMWLGTEDVWYSTHSICCVIKIYTSKGLMFLSHLRKNHNEKLEEKINILTIDRPGSYNWSRIRLYDIKDLWDGPVGKGVTSQACWPELDPSDSWGRRAQTCKTCSLSSTYVHSHAQVHVQINTIKCNLNTLM